MSSRIIFPPSEHAPSAPVPSSVDENWAGVDIMYYLDGRWRRQALVYFGKPKSHPLKSRWFREPRGCVPPPQPVKIRPRRTSTSIIAGDLSSHQSKYVWVWETSVPGPGRALTFLEELSTSSCPNTPGDVQGPLKKPPMRPVLSRFLYKLKTGFLTLPRRFTPLARVKLQGASRTVQSTISNGRCGTPHE